MTGPAGTDFLKLIRWLPLERGSHSLYLVGGAVRDLLLGRATHDMDFAVAGEPRDFARQVANELGGVMYMLDESRGSARAIVNTPVGSPMVVDFVKMQGESIEEDLRQRDFTINAMAVALSNPGELIDPLCGMKDLEGKMLRACSSMAIFNDPVRILRAVRLAVDLDYSIPPETRESIQKGVSMLPQVSVERVRDELFRILDGHGAARALRMLDSCGALEKILPDLQVLKGLHQSAPHTLDGWEHTLSGLEWLSVIWESLIEKGNHRNREDSSVRSSLEDALGTFGKLLSDFYAQRLNPERTLRSLLAFAFLYHDAGKPAALHLDSDGRTRFLGHEQKGAGIVGGRARSLALSEAEVQRLGIIVNEHMRIHWLARDSEDGETITRRVIYRYFHATGEAGVDICLVTLADTLATYGNGLPADLWKAELAMCRVLLGAWWQQRESVIQPPRLLGGDDLMQILDLPPGPLIGKLLSSLQEAQASGEVNTREEAEKYVAELLASGWEETDDCGKSGREMKDLKGD